MTPEHALIRAVLDRPADDLPRLVLADYLDERGSQADHARAELIRLGCRIAELNGRISHGGPFPGGGPAEFADGEMWVMRQNALLKKWGRRWLPGVLRRHHTIGVSHEWQGNRVERVVGPARDATTFERGFPARLSFDLEPHYELITIDASAIAGVVRSFFAAAPLETVTLTFDGAEHVAPPLVLEITDPTRTPSVDLTYAYGKVWRLGWTEASFTDYLELGRPPFGTSQAVLGLSRAELSKNMAAWLAETILRTGRRVADQLAVERGRRQDENDAADELSSEQLYGPGDANIDDPFGPEV